MCLIVLLAMCFQGLILLKTTLILCNIFKFNIFKFLVLSTAID